MNDNFNLCALFKAAKSMTFFSISTQHFGRFLWQFLDDFMDNFEGALDLDTFLENCFESTSFRTRNILRCNLKSYDKLNYELSILDMELQWSGSFLTR